MNLYQLSAHYQALLDKDEYSDDEHAELLKAFGDIKNEAVNRVKYIKNLEAEHAAVKYEASNMHDRAVKLQMKITREKERLADRLQECDIDEVKDSKFTIKIKNNPPAVEDYNRDTIPQGYWVEKKSLALNKKLIKHDLDQGIKIPGARLIQRKHVTY